MERKLEDPMDVVEYTAAVLSRISSLCAIMMSIDDHDSVPSEKVGKVMTHFHFCLEEQIKALDAIQWTQ